MDDIIAITMIISSGNFTVEGIITVKGLTTPTVGKKNIIKVLKFLNNDIEVVSGSKSPLNKKGVKYSFSKQDVINSSKLLFLQDLLKTEVYRKQKYSVNRFLFQKVCLNKNKVSLLCLGPLTNIARAIKTYGEKFTKK